MPKKLKGYMISEADEGDNKATLSINVSTEQCVTKVGNHRFLAKIITKHIKIIQKRIS